MPFFCTPVTCFSLTLSMDRWNQQCCLSSKRLATAVCTAGLYLIMESENLFHQPRGKGIFKAWGKPEFMMLAAAVFLPTCLLRNLSWLAYFSAIGVLSSWLLLTGS